MSLLIPLLSAGSFGSLVLARIFIPSSLLRHGNTDLLNLSQFLTYIPMHVCTGIFQTSCSPWALLGKHPYVLHPAAAREARSQRGSGLLPVAVLRGLCMCPTATFVFPACAGFTACVPRWLDWGQKLVMLCTGAMAPELSVLSHQQQNYTGSQVVGKYMQQNWKGRI